MMLDFLTYDLDNSPVVAAYIGTQSNSFCYRPYERKIYFNDWCTKEAYNCEENDSGHYSALCRSWFRNQRDNPD